MFRNAHLFRFALLLVVMLAAGALAACAPAPPTPTASTPAVGPEATAPGLDWDRSPEAIIFRLDTGGSSPDRASDLNALPYCTLYGDGHLIWLNPGTNPEETLEALIDEATMRAFLQSLIDDGFYRWEPQQTGMPEGRGDGPLVDRVVLTLFGETHVVDSASNWPPGTFDTLQTRCRQLSDSPVIYVPTGVWVSALPTQESADRVYSWANYAATYEGVALAAIPPDRPRWFTGEAAAEAWTLARRGRVVLADGGSNYRLIVQVPGLQVGAPAPPR